VILPLFGDILPIWFPSVNHILPSGPAQIPSEPTLLLARLYLVTLPFLGDILPILSPLIFGSVNHKLPSGPLVIAYTLKPTGPPVDTKLAGGVGIHPSNPNRRIAQQPTIPNNRSPLSNIIYLIDEEIIPDTYN
jgi:hypothetical protein